MLPLIEPRRSRARTLLLVTLGVLLWAPVLCRAQATGTLAGSAADQTGAGLPGVRVAIRGPESRDVETNAAGSFEVQRLQAGDYDVVAELSGFREARRSVRITAGERVVVSLALQVALAEQTSVAAAKAGSTEPHGLPMAINAVSGEELGREGTTTIDQAASLSPSVTFTQTANFGQLSIRGIGTNAVYAGADPSAVMYLDGVYLARPAMALVQFLDLERLEVLRGPQGTLYGRNAVGGALNLVSRPPTNELQAAARLVGGTLGGLRAEVRAGGPIKRDRIMGSVAFMRSLQDGYVRDLEHPDHPMGGDDVTAARGQLRVVVDRRVDLLLSGDVSHQDATPLAFNKVLAEKPGVDVDNPVDLREVRTSEPASHRLVQYGGSARVTAALTPTTTVVSLTALRALDYEFLLDNDITELDVTTFRSDERQHQLSEEVIVSHRQGRLDVVGGVFLFTERDRQQLGIDQPAARTTIRLQPSVGAASRAVFAQATVRLSDRISATAGLRYTRERKDIDNAGGRFGLDDPTTSVPGSTYAYTDAITHSAWTPKFGVQVRWPRETLAYVSATRGFKSGGFNLTSTEPGRGFAPEWAWSYEAGLKATHFAGRARSAVAAFVMDYTNLQVQNPIQQGVIDIRNAAAATIRGVEVEHTSRWPAGFESGGHLTWLDARYDQYIAVNLGGVLGDVAGNRLNNAPEWAGRLWIAWSGSLGPGGRLSLHADATAQSTVFYSPFNDGIQRQLPYGLLAARVEYGPRTQRWSLAAYARNLTSTDYITGAFGNSPVAFGGRPGPPRQFAVEFTIRR